MKKKNINPLKPIIVAVIILALIGYMMKCAFDCKRSVDSLTEIQLNETPNYKIY